MVEPTLEQREWSACCTMVFSYSYTLGVGQILLVMIDAGPFILKNMSTISQKSSSYKNRLSKLCVWIVPVYSQKSVMLRKDCEMWIKKKVGKVEVNLAILSGFLAVNFRQFDRFFWPV